MLTSIGLVLESLISCARLRLNCKQRILILEIYGSDSGITELIDGLALRLECSVGCLWGNLRELSEIGLVEDGILTEIGEVVYLELEGLKGGGLR